MKLFLGGGGGGNDSIELDKKFVENLDLSKPLLYIPIATNTQKYPYSGCVAWILSVLSPLGVKNVIMWTEDDLKQKTEKDFDQFCGVYIGGGNTFKLLKELKEFGTLEILRKLVDKNIPIYGGSAGAIILAKTIIPAISADENIVGLTDFFALNLINNYDVWCHYTPEMDTEVLNYMNMHDLEKIIAIPENGGLQVTDDSIEVVGPGQAVIFNKTNKDRLVIEPGHAISD